MKVKTSSVKSTVPEFKRLDLAEAERIYMTDALVRNAINTSVHLFDCDYEIEASTSRIKNEVEVFLDSIDFPQLRRDIARDAFVYGDAWCELVYKNNELIGVVGLNPRTIDYQKTNMGAIKLDRYGNPVGYLQAVNAEQIMDSQIQRRLVTVGGVTGIPLRNDQVARFYFDKIGDGWYGLGLIEPIYSVTLGKNEAEMGLSHVIHKVGFPIIIMSVGDSVLGSRYTYIKKGNQIDVITFEELYELVEGTEKTYGHITVKYLNEDIETLSVDKNGQIEWKKIKAVSKHKIASKLLCLQQKYGETIVTNDHSIYADDFTVTRAKNNPTLYAWRRSVPIKQIQDIELPKITVKESKYSFPKTKQHNKLNGQDLIDFCKFLGAYISEGAIVKSSCGNRKAYHVSIFNTKKHWLEKLKSITDRLFGLHGCLEKSSVPNSKDKKIVYRLRYSSKYLYLLVEKLCSHSAQNKRLPPFIYNAPREAQLAILEYLIDGDGYRTNEKRFTDQYKRNQFEYATISQPLAAGLSLLLNILGINYSIRYKTTRKGHVCYSFRRVQRPRTCVCKKRLHEFNYDGYVYDIEVEDNHNFFDGLGMVLCHNSEHEPSPDMINNGLNLIKDLNYKTELSIPYYMKVDTLKVTRIEKLKEFLDYFIEQQITGMGLPGAIATGRGEDVNRSTLVSQIKIFMKINDARRNLFAYQFNTQVLARLAKSRNWHTTPKIVPKPTDIESLLEGVQKDTKRDKTGEIG